MYRHTIFLLILAIAAEVSALNILGIVSVPYRSHYMAFKAIFREYAKRGHSVTVINHFPDEEPLKNLRFVNLQGNTTANVTSLDEYENYNGDLVHVYNFFHHLTRSPKTVLNDCDCLLTSANAKAHLAEGNKYDVILVEQFVSDCGLAYAAALYDAPIIGITSHVLLPWAYTRLGIPFNAASDIYYFTSSGLNPSLLAKVEVTVSNFLFNTIGRWHLQNSIYDSFSRNMPEVTFDLERLAQKKLKMMFSYQHFSLTGARLLAPQVLEIAGAHVSTPKPLENDIEKFLSTAEHGAVYVSFGSNLKASTMSPEKLQQFLKAFKSIPQKVLWKWEGESFPAGHDNILPKKWFPQVDVLCHPKVVAFISHGGMLSMSETAHCGKPALAVPFFGDQFSNAASVKASGLGKFMYFQDITAETLAEAIKELTSPEMQQSARNVSKLWHDRPQPVLDSALYWTEYVARHSAAPPALPSANNAWYEAMLLDVYTVLIAIAFLLYWICYLIYKLVRLIICRLICRRFCKRKVKKN